MAPTSSGRTFARRRDLNGEVRAWDMAYGTSPTASEPPRSLSDLRFPLLRSWQKPRFLPAETKLMSDKRAGARLVDRRSTRRVPSRDGMAQKAPQATFSNQTRDPSAADHVAALKKLPRIPSMMNWTARAASTTPDNRLITLAAVTPSTFINRGAANIRAHQITITTGTTPTKPTHNTVLPQTQPAVAVIGARAGGQTMR